MASARSEEETFTCSVCLDTPKDPTALPCGHSYCPACIHSHWDKKHPRGQHSCPQCRRVFEPRPPPAESTVLADRIGKTRPDILEESSSAAAVSTAPPSSPIYLEVLPAREAYPRLVQRPLDLCCCEDEVCVCEVCRQHGHEGHRVLRPREERKERPNFAITEPQGAEEESTLSQEEEEEEEEEVVVVSVHLAMKELRESIQELCDASLAKIATLVNPDPGALTPGGAAALASPDSVQAASSNSADATTRDQPPSLPPRRRHGDPSRRPRHLPASAPPPPLPPRQPQTSPAERVINVEPKTREEMLKFRFQPTMDANTVYRHVQLSDGGRKAAMRAEDLNLPDHAERFHFWRQALCGEALAGSPYYWEVEWTGKKITIGVAYKEMERKASDDSSLLGHNAQSWSLCWSASGFSFWHDGEEKLLGSPKARRIGVYLDQHAGVLAFYRIARNQAELIHQHLSQFTRPLFPGFRFWPGGGSTVTVCQLD